LTLKPTGAIVARCVERQCSDLKEQVKMTMQRRHFELIAKGIRAGKPPAVAHLTPAMDVVAMGQWRQSARSMASVLADTTPNFNRERFLRACGVDQ
jgi:hypothetical protein